jgi:hypothetical protein
MSIATDVVDAQIEAYQARDVERFLSHYAGDVSVVLRRHADVREQGGDAGAIREAVRGQPRPAPDHRQPHDRRGVRGRSGGDFGLALR